MRWVANMLPAGTTRTARAKARAARPAGKIELTGIQPAAAFNISIANEVYAHRNETDMWPRMPVENVQVVLGRTSIPDPYLDGVNWDIVVCVFAPFGGTRIINNLKYYDVVEGETARKEEGPGGMLCVNAVANKRYHSVSPEYIGAADKVKALIAAIEDAVTPFFAGLPFSLVLDGSGSYTVTAGGGGGSGGSRQIRRPQWTTTLLGGTGGDGGSGGYKPAPGGDGWRAHLLQQCNKLEVNLGGAAPYLTVNYGSQPGYADGYGYTFIGSGDKTLSYNGSGWGIQARWPNQWSLALYMGPFDGAKPTYIGSRNAFTPKEPRPFVSELIYMPAVHPTSGGDTMGDNAYIGFDCPITLDHMRAVCQAGLVGACTERTYKNPYFVEGLNVDFDPASYKVVWGFDIS